MKKSDTNVVSVLQDDGVEQISWDQLTKYQNTTSINLEAIRKDLGMGSWAVRIAYNNLFGGVIIQQHPGQGNRKHYHPDADENWVVMEGEWEWWIDGQGKKLVKENYIIVVPANTWHQMKCVGNSVGVRYAITKPDVEHIYE